MESRRDRGTEPCGNRRLVAAIITQAKSKRTAIATAAVLLAAILALAWPHAMPMGNKDEGNSAASTQGEAAGTTEGDNETSSVARGDANEVSGPTTEDAQSGEAAANESRTTGNGSNVPSSGKSGKDSGGSGSGNSSAQGAVSHRHNWVAQTKTVHHDARYKTVHHDAQYKTVHHDAVVKLSAFAITAARILPGTRLLILRTRCLMAVTVVLVTKSLVPCKRLMTNR